MCKERKRGCGVEEKKDGEICAFSIHGSDAPFEAVVLNRTSGEGQLRARSPVDCERQREYTFTIQAHDCGSGPGGFGAKKSHKAVVHVQVGDVNEFTPVFSSGVYSGSVQEGRVCDSILQVEASDRDCSPQYSQICNYQIVTENAPFAIDRNGNIRNTESLSFDTQSHYEISVTAFDCGQKRATRSATVHIHVKPICKPGWQGWSKRVDYEPGMGSKPLFPKMHLETCEGTVSSVRTTVELQTGHIGKGCDRETYSEKSLQKLCGASSGSTDLLPAPSAAFNWTMSLLTDGGRDSELIFHFDGRQAAKIPDWVAPQNLTDQFTIATWMKHGPSPGLRGEKETLLCNSDKTEMNRHHYSLYVHNCRLVFLLRRDYTQSSSFRPAEFHWKLEQICDKEWHYYVINVEFPVVTLYVDGVTYDPYLVTDDWPIHSSQIDVQLTVGACWQEEKMGVCHRETMTVEEQFHFNPAQSVLVIEGEDLEQVNAALRKVSYINSRQFPTAGARHLDTVVMVMQPSEPRITITGAEHLSIPASDLVLGLSLFRDLHISSTVMRSDQTSHNTGEELREGLETLQLPHSALLGKHLDYTNSTSGMSIYGVDSMVHYAQVLRQVRYQNLQNGVSARTFRVTCSELNGRYTSNPFTQQINILHREQPVKHVSHIMAQPKPMQLSHHPATAFNTQSADVSSVVIVVCVAVLMVVVVSVVYQIHLKYVQGVPDANTQSKKEKDLDLSALTITVNPLESFEELQPAEELTEEEVEDEEEEDDDDDITSSESDSDDEEAPIRVVQHLKNGELLHQAYLKHHKLLPPDWSSQHLWVETTAKSRTLQSGLALLYGFLPNFDWSKVMVRQQRSTIFCGSWCDCPARNFFLDEEQRRQYRLRTSNAELERAYVDMAKALGVVTRTMRAANPIDALLCHLCHGLPFPCASSHLSPASENKACITLQHFAVIRQQQRDDERERKKAGIYRRFAVLAAHPFLNRTAMRMEKAARGNSEPVFALASAHDITMAPLLSALGLEGAGFPRFAARLVFELWKSPDIKGKGTRGGVENAYVRVLYNGEDLTFETAFCRDHDRHSSQPLCPLGNFLSFVRRGMFSIVNATSYYQACHQNF
ncbi:Calsyntenin-2 [Bagarius yarrelli]|uniref:Calsyntenin-2 n=1 Tax=Bagarius yarrelli TaxID=175774 RepID=A0A556U5U8_BAGYA|nr:Calsyntenin-2 [Bagarius yarrelli]